MESLDSLPPLTLYLLKFKLLLCQNYTHSYTRELFFTRRHSNILSRLKSRTNPLKAADEYTGSTELGDVVVLA